MPGGRRRRWRRWLIGLAALAIVARVALGLSLPWILDRVARTYGLAAAVDGTALSLLGGSFELRGLRLHPAGHAATTASSAAESGAPAGADRALPATALATLAFVRADIDMSALVFGRLRLHSLGVAGMRVAIARDANGEWQWPTPPAAESEADQKGEPLATEPVDVRVRRALDFRSPVEIESVHLGAVHVQWRDDAIAPPVDTELSVDAAVYDFGHETRPAKVELDVAVRDVLDAVRVRATVSAAERALDMSVALEVRGARPATVAAYLDAVGLRARVGRGDIALGLHGRLTPRLDDETGATGEFGLSLRVLADGREAMAIDAVKVPIDHLDSAELRVGAATVTGVRAAVGRDRDGAMRLPWFDLVARAPAVSPAPPPAVPTTSPASAAPFAITVAQVSLEQIAFSFSDAAVEPPAQLAVNVPSLSVDRIALGAPGTSPTTWVANLELPDLVRTLTVTGTWTPQPQGGEAAAQVRADGVTLAALAPYLAPAGCAPALRAGTLSVDLGARLQTTGDRLEVPVLTIDGLQVRDGERELMALDTVRVEGVLMDGSRVAIERVALAGTRAHLARDVDGGVLAMGLRFASAPGTAPPLANETSPQPAPPPSNDPSQPAPPTSSSFNLGALTWSAGPITWSDALPVAGDGANQVAAELAIDQIDVEVRALRLQDGLPTLESLRATVRSAALVDEVALQGAIRDEAGTAALSATVRAVALRPEFAMRYAMAAGVRPTFTTAAFAADLDARLKRVADGVEVSAAVRDVEFAMPGASLFKLASVRLAPSRFAAANSVVGAVECERPLLTLAREADGSLVAAGFRLLPPDPTAPGVPAPTATPQGPSRGDDAPALALGPLRLVDAEVQWRDAAVQPALACDLRLNAEVAGVGAPGPMSFAAQVAVLPTSGTLAVEGSVEHSDDEVVVTAQVSGDALQADRFQAYLPPSVRIEPGTRALQLTTRLALGVAAAGGTRIDVQVPSLTARDGVGATLFGFEDAALRIARFDPIAQVVAIDAVVVRSIEAEVARVAEGTRLFGLTLLSAVTADGRPTGSPTPPPSPEAETPAQIAPPSTGLGGRRASSLPTVTLRQLDLDVQRLMWRDATSATAVPLVGSARLQHDAPVTLLAPDPDELPPVSLHVVAALPPIVDEVGVDLTWTPASTEPRLEVALAARGVHPEGLVAVDPTLALRIDPAHSTLAEITAKLGVGLRLPVGGLTDLDPERALGAEVELQEFLLRDAAGVVVAGIDAVRVDVQSLAPATGALHVKTVEIEGLRGRVEHTADGMRVAGLLLRPPTTPEGAPAGEPSAAPPVAAEPPSLFEAAAPAVPAHAPADVRVDTLAISGIDFAFHDATATPPVDIPLTGLDVEVKGFTTRALREPVPIMFSASLNGGMVSLQERSKASSVVTGLLGAMGRAVVGGADRFKLEQRPVFDEIAFAGRLQLAPRMQGWTRLDVGALELPALAGLVAGSGVEIGDGVLDSSVRVRFDGQGSTAVQSHAHFTDLSVSEPAGGPISTYLKLPAPLDAVLFALENEDAEHRIPLAFGIDSRGVSTSEIALSATAALGKLLTSALAAAPLRAAGTVTGLVGLTGGVAAAVVPAQLEFVAGDVALPQATAAAVAETLAHLEEAEGGVVVLEHTLGADDVPRAAAFGNPDPSDALAMATGLRKRAVELARARDLVAIKARTEVLTGVESRATVERLRAIDAELATVDVALGSVLEVLRPGAERRADARTRAACRSMGEQRLAAVRRAVLAASGEGMAGRIEVRRPKAEPPTPPSLRGSVLLSVKPRAGG